MPSYISPQRRREILKFVKDHEDFLETYGQAIEELGMDKDQIVTALMGYSIMIEAGQKPTRELQGQIDRLFEILEEKRCEIEARDQQNTRLTRNKPQPF